MSTILVSHPPGVSSSAWDPNRPLLTLGTDSWRIRDACEGVMIFGGTGSGKTSGSGAALARAYLGAGFGGLVLCTKPEEPAQWRQYCAETGRAGDRIGFGGSEAPDLSFNFMDHEARRGGDGAGLTENLVQLFVEVASLGAENGAGRGGDPFWERAMRSLIRNCIDLLILSEGPVSLHGISAILQSAPADPAQAKSPEWRASSECWRRLESATALSKGRPSAWDAHEVRAYWSEHFPALGDRTRGSIVAMFTTLAEPVMRGRMRELFCGETTLAPEQVLDGRVIVVELPLKEWGEVGRFAAVLWKYCVQKAIERRGDNASGLGRPVFIWADECQYFVSRHDTLFQSTARSSRAATVYLTQNYPNLVAALGGSAAGRSQIDSLMGNLGTKFFHANSDRDTNQFAADLVGKRLQAFRSAGAGTNLGFGGSAGFGSSAHHGVSEHVDYEIQPREWAVLAKGGPENGFQTEALIFQNGRTWGPAGRTWQKVAFGQRPAQQAIQLPLGRSIGRR